jgi:hypothetical protein
MTAEEVLDHITIWFTRQGARSASNHLPPSGILGRRTSFFRRKNLYTVFYFILVLRL